MSYCLRTLSRWHASVFFIETDCPAFSVADLNAEMQPLQQGRRMVFIPADDGGYVLVGASARGDPDERDRMLLQSLAAIDWGTPQVMSQTRHRLTNLGWTRGRDWEELAALWDVDIPDDYRRARQVNLLTA